MSVPLTQAVNPVAEASAGSQFRKNAEPKEQTTAKMMARALDPAKKSERSNRTGKRRDGRGLDIRA